MAATTIRRLLGYGEVWREQEGKPNAPVKGRSHLWNAWASVRGNLRECLVWKVARGSVKDMPSLQLNGSAFHRHAGV